jgi:beta-xylosidase-like protein
MDRIDEDLYDLLKNEVWEKAFESSVISKGNYYYDQIRKKILKERRHSLSKDTIRNFFEGKHSPSLKTLDIFSDFVLGVDNNPIKFTDYKARYHARKVELVKTLEGESKNKNSMSFKIRLLILLVVILFLFWASRKFNTQVNLISTNDIINTIYSSGKTKVEPFNCTFLSSNLNVLKNSGWFLFKDSINLDLWNNQKYESNGYLTLETFLGDSFLENRMYDPKVINVLAKEISCGSCCELYVKIVDFNPSQRYQQAGFFVFYDDKTYPSIRMTLHNRGVVSMIKRNGKYSNESLIISKEYTERARAYSVKNNNVINPIDSIVLKMRIENNQYFFSHKVDTSANFIDIRSTVIDFPTPKYIGLTAFQGRPEIPYPVYPIADVIPAKFEYVKVLSCKDK